MPRIHTFNGYLVNAARAAQTVAPAYDAVSPAKRREFIAANPDNYLGCMRLREDFPEDARPDTDKLLAVNRAQLHTLLQSGAYRKFDRPSIFIYRLSHRSHTQTGVVCELSADEYHNGRLRKHENTRSDKEDLLAKYQQVVGVASSPICVAHARHAGVDEFIRRGTQPPPEIDFAGADGVAQQVWRVVDADAIRRAQELFAEIDTTYLTDGHHRAAAGWRYAQMRRARADPNENSGDAAPYDQLLVALFSADQLQLLPYHRVARDLNGRSAEEFLAALNKDFSVEKISGDEFTPTAYGEFGMLLERQWYRLRLQSNLRGEDDPVDSLDVSILQNYILRPLLGILDARADARLDYVSGGEGGAGLRQKCADGWALGFAVCPTAMRQLFAVADAGLLMPPKSTYFEPKTRAGIFIRTYENLA